MVKLRYIMTGTGRNGSGYIANILNKNGIKTGHENLFGICPRSTSYVDYARNNIKSNKILQAESSWLIAPFLREDFISKDTKLLHIIRNPYHFIKSTVEINDINLKNAHSPYVRHVMKYGKVDLKSQIPSLTDFYLNWITMIEDQRKLFNNSAIIKLEELKDSQGFLSKFFETNIKISSIKINTKTNRKSKLSRKQHFDIIKSIEDNEDLLELIKKYNYDINSIRY